MKIYSNTYDLTKPMDRQIYVAPNSIYAFGVKVVKAGEPVSEYSIAVYEDGVELTPMEAAVDGFTLFQKTSPSVPTTKTYDIVYTKGDVEQHFVLIDNTTNSTVFDIDQAGGIMDLPIATQSVLGGVKIGANLTIEADGTLNADDQKAVIKAGNGIQISQDNTISIDSTVALKQDIPTKVSGLENDEGYIKPDSTGKVTVTEVSTQKLTVGTNLDINGVTKVQYSNLLESNTNQRYDKWLAESQNSNVKTALDNAGKVKTVNNIQPDQNGNIEIQTGGGSAYTLVNGNWTLNQQDGVYEYDIANNTVVTLVLDQNTINYRVNLPAADGNNVRDFVIRFETAIANTTVTFNSSDNAQYESADVDWSQLDLGVNIISFTETKRN